MAYQKLTKIPESVQRTLQDIIRSMPRFAAIIQAIHAVGGTPFLVGGAVRDLLIGVPLKDFDCEVHHLSLDQLQTVLAAHGEVDLVGKAFGVLRVHGLDIDWSVPRKDNVGRKPTVELDSAMDITQAFMRRDLTMNAMGIDLVSFALVDPFDGWHDIQLKRLRAPSLELFVQDPLRLFRVMQFIGRFEMMPDDALDHVCSSMDIAGLSRERIDAEFEKLMLKSRRPSLGIRWLDRIGRLNEILPELAATKGIEQDSLWHPEGDVFEHTMQSIDAAAVQNYASQEQKLAVMYAALCHDLGKVSITQHVDGRIISYGHAQAGVPLARSLMKRITTKKDLIDAVAVMVAHHMEPLQFVAQGASAAAYKRLARKIYPLVNMQMLTQLALADKQGRNPHGHEPLSAPIEDVELFMQKAASLTIIHHPEEPILLGRDLLDVIQPGKLLGEALDYAYQIQLDEEIHSRELLRERVLEWIATR